MSVIFGPGIGMQPAQGSLVEDTNPVDQAPIVVQATDTQSGNLMEFRSPSGTLLSAVDVNGAIGGAAGLAGAVILAPASAGRNTIQPAADAVDGLTIKGHSPTQSSPLLQFENSVGAVTGSVTPLGAVRGQQLVGKLSVSDTNLDTFISDWGAQQDALIAIGDLVAPIDCVGMQPDGATAGRAVLAFITFNPNSAGSKTWQYFRIHGSALLDNAGAISGQSLAIDDENGFSIINMAKAKLAFFGANPVSQQTNGTAADLAAIADAPAKAFITALSTALVNLGLLAAPA